MPLLSLANYQITGLLFGPPCVLQSSESGQLANPERLKKLVEADMSTSVFVNVRHDLSHFGLGEFESVVIQSLHQFVAVQRFAAVVIHDAKRSARHQSAN